MAVGLVGQKLGMTRLFTEDGVVVPVTVVAVPPNRVTQVKTSENDGYRALQVTVKTKQRIAHPNKALAGHFAKSGVEIGDGLWEFRLTDNETDEINVGHEFKVDMFQIGQKVDVSGVSRGKGFAGTVKRHNFKMQDASHGNSRSHRVPGSIGQRQTPGRVFKGKPMAGHMGNANCTVQSQEVIKIDPERNLLLIKGAIPGAPGGYVVILPSVKKKGKV
ncbi:MAG: 50S ribosomal protein L3 [Gammaproteobacteria bacterium]